MTDSIIERVESPKGGYLELRHDGEGYKVELHSQCAHDGNWITWEKRLGTMRSARREYLHTLHNGFKQTIEFERDTHN